MGLLGTSFFFGGDEVLFLLRPVLLVSGILAFTAVLFSAREVPFDGYVGMGWWEYFLTLLGELSVSVSAGTGGRSASKSTVASDDTDVEFGAIV